jgi:hypothetical protein
MASTSRTFDSRTSATTSASSNRGTSNRGTTTTSARERVLINAALTEATAKAELAKKEEAQRTAPVTGTLAGYDATVGSYLFTTPDGGTIRAELLSDGAPTGLAVPLQRFGDSQTCAAQTRPSGNAGGNVVSQIESAQREVVNLLSTEALDFRIEAPEETTYILSAYQHYPVRIEALLGVSGATVVTSPAIGEVAAVGEPISITVSALADPVVPVVGSILLRRVG